ncbi:205_t:CDS:1, partial [Dentiscutata heterogama]
MQNTNQIDAQFQATFKKYKKNLIDRCISFSSSNHEEIIYKGDGTRVIKIYDTFANMDM